MISPIEGKDYQMKFANIFASLLALALASVMIFQLQIRANAFINGPCPAQEWFNFTTCPIGSIMQGAYSGIQTCVQGDPLNVNGSSYYRCCIYDEANIYCVSQTTSCQLPDGTYERLRVELGPGKCLGQQPFPDINGSWWKCLAW